MEKEIEFWMEGKKQNIIKVGIIVVGIILAAVIWFVL